MGFSRKDIYGTSPLDIKNLNDNLKYMWKKVFGNISTGDIMPGSVTKKILSKDLQTEIDESKKNIETTQNNIDQLEKDTDAEVAVIINQMNDINTSKVSNNIFTSTITQLNNAILNRVTSADFQSYALQTDNKIASKVSNNDFSTYKVQTANEIASKVSGSEFNSYKSQTDNSISNLITKDGLLASLIEQTDKRISLVVRGSSINGDAIVSAINMSDSRIDMSALNINLSGYVTISDLRGGYTTIDGDCIKTGTISSNRLNVDEIGSQITKVSRFIWFNGSSSNIAGIGVKTSGSKEGYVWIYSDSGIIFDCSDDKIITSSGSTIATREWVDDRLEKFKQVLDFLNKG